MCPIVGVVDETSEVNAISCRKVLENSEGADLVAFVWRKWNPV